MFYDFSSILASLKSFKQQINERIKDKSHYGSCQRLDSQTEKIIFSTVFVTKLT